MFYYKNGEIIGDTSKIVEMFLKDTKQLKNASIFSSEDIQKSTYDIIMGISDINTFNSGVRKILINGEIQEVEVPVVTDFIVQPNTLFEKLGIKTSSGRLNPEYIKENRIAAYILENYKKVEDLTSFDKDSVVYSKDLFQLYRNDDRFIKFNDNQIIYLLSEIEDIIEFENKVMRFGELLHTLLFLKVRNQSYNSELNRFIKDPNNKDIIGEGSADQWKSKISYIINSIYDRIINIGLPITEIFLNSDIVRGRVDLIAVDRSGNAHIFDLKVSKNSYDNWDSAKLGTLDWQLAMYRQLLGQHINIDNTMLYTIPIKISYLGDPNVVYLEDFQNRSLTKRLRPEGEITVFANKILPRRIVTDYNPERESNILSKLNTLFKGEDYEIKTDIVQLDPEKILKLAEDTFARTGRWKYWPEVEIAGEAKTYITGDTREEFEANLNNYLQRANKLVNNEALLIRDALNSAILNKTRITTSKNDEYNILLNKLFGNYITDDWEVVNNIPEAIAMGIILLRNKLNNNISIVSMTTNQPYAISKVDGLSYGELEFMKSFLLLMKWKRTISWRIWKIRTNNCT